MATYTNNDPFYYWVSSSGTTSTATPTSDVWYEWHTTDTTSGITSTSLIHSDAIWESWHTGDNYKVEYTARPYISNIVTSPKLTSEEKRARAAQRDINKMWRDLRIQEEEERKEKAELTAQELLLDLIGEKELAYYRETGRLLVKGRKYDYVIKKAGGVYQVEKDKVIDLCIHLKEKYKYPDTDNVIGLMLMLKANEREFLKIANSHGEVKQSVRDRVLELVERAA
jgi:hypothetical protein